MSFESLAEDPRIAALLGSPSDDERLRECAGTVETWCQTHASAWELDEDRCVRILVGWYHPEMKRSEDVRWAPGQGWHER